VEESLVRGDSAGCSHPASACAAATDERTELQLRRCRILRSRPLATAAFESVGVESCFGIMVTKVSAVQVNIE
jgi:hypothetical protein